MSGRLRDYPAAAGLDPAEDDLTVVLELRREVARRLDIETTHEVVDYVLRPESVTGGGLLRSPMSPSAAWAVIERALDHAEGTLAYLRGDAQEPPAGGIALGDLDDEVSECECDECEAAAEAQS